MGHTHSLLALTGAVVIASTSHASYTEAGILIGGAVTTAKLPDVDCRIPGVKHRGPLTHSLLAAGFLSITATIVAAFVAPEFALLVGAGVALGVVLHQLADGLTISGVPMFWPVVRSDVHLLPEGFRFYTGTPKRERTWKGETCKRCHRSARVCRCGKAEHAFSFLLLAGLLGFVWMTYGR